MHIEDNGNIAIIGGTGFENLPPEIFADPIIVETRFGRVEALSLSDNYTEPQKLYFLARHGTDHHLAPHQINYAANIAALLELDVRHVFATNAVGSLRLELAPGTLVLLDDFIDFTRQRPMTFEQNPGQWHHTDFSVPYSQRLRMAIIAAANLTDTAIVDGGTYLCCDGPRFETPAEIKMFAAWGADVVGMTGLPEAVFAREAGLSYAALGIITNYGAGLTSAPVDHKQVTEVMAQNIGPLREMLIIAAGLLVTQTAN